MNLWRSRAAEIQVLNKTLIYPPGSSWCLYFGTPVLFKWQCGFRPSGSSWQIQGEINVIAFLAKWRTLSILNCLPWPVLLYQIEEQCKDSHTLLPEQLGSCPEGRGVGGELSPSGGASAVPKWSLWGEFGTLTSPWDESRAAEAAPTAKVL